VATHEVEAMGAKIFRLAAALSLVAYVGIVAAVCRVAAAAVVASLALAKADESEMRTA
jgi:molybdopterin biosynthesis enzyme